MIHLQSLMQPGQGSICDINAKFNCSEVINSAYGELASIPLGAYGMTYFVIIFVAAMLPKISMITRRQLLVLESAIGFVGFLGVLALLYISNVILGKICPSCSVVHLLVIVYFAMKLVGLYRNKKMAPPATKNAAYLTRFFVVSGVLGILPLIVGVFAPLIIANNLANADKDTPQPVVATPTITTIHGQLMQFNPTNDVGNGEDYRRGSDKAKVILQMFSDFGCPHCKRVIPAIVEAQDEVGQDKVLIVYRFFPLNADCNSYLPNDNNHWYPYSCMLPQASRCAGQQGKFWEFKDWGFEGQDWAESDRQQHFSEDGLKAEAKKLGMDSDKFMQCIASGSTLAKIRADEDLAEHLKIQGTPYIFINGEVYEGGATKTDFVNAFRAHLDGKSTDVKSTQ